MVQMGKGKILMDKIRNLLLGYIIQISKLGTLTPYHLQKEANVQLRMTSRRNNRPCLTNQVESQKLSAHAALIVSGVEDSKERNTGQKLTGHYDSLYHFVLKFVSF